jgi:Heavy metal binding domain
MSAPYGGERIYTCPVHKGVQQPGPGKCPLCGKTLQPEGGRYAFIHQLLANPLPILVMAAIMIVLAIAAMMIR